VARLGIIFLYYEIFGVQNFCHFPPIFWHFLAARIMHRIIYLNYIILYRSICNMPYYIKHLSKVTVTVKKSEKVEHFRGGFKILSPPFACIIHGKRGPPPGIECQVEGNALPQIKILKGICAQTRGPYFSSVSDTRGAAANHGDHLGMCVVLSISLDVLLPPG
jgi:hypothetical protein